MKKKVTILEKAESKIAIVILHEEDDMSKSLVDEVEENLEKMADFYMDDTENLADYISERILVEDKCLRKNFRV